MQDEKSRDYMNARRVAREYEAITKGLNKNIPSVPPTNTPEELKQVSQIIWLAVVKINILFRATQTLIAFFFLDSFFMRNI